MRTLKHAIFCGVCFPALFAGDIQFEIRDHTVPMGPKLIASGVKKQTPKEVREIKIPGIAQITEFVPLSDGFALKISTPGEKSIDGFGLSGWCSSGLFSWEWFNHDQGTTFKKLQEGGSLKVICVEKSGVMRITSIEILSDISIRLKESGSDKITYRILLKKGSIITLAS